MTGFLHILLDVKSYQEGDDNSILTTVRIHTKVPATMVAQALLNANAMFCCIALTVVLLKPNITLQVNAMASEAL